MILVEGAPGTGKSRAILNLNPETTLIIRPNTKDLPFVGAKYKYKEGTNVVTVSEFAEVREMLEMANKGNQFKTVILEDITHWFSKRVMGEANEKGYKFRRCNQYYKGEEFFLNQETLIKSNWVFVPVGTQLELL